MPEDSKKNVDKNKHEAKDQRKPRHSRNQAAKADKKVEKVEENKAAPKEPQKPTYKTPGPEFYKNLKRETDDIVTITEAENAKYRKKEIQSNWAKYEMPIESYEEAEDQDTGADYEKLIQASLSAGGHFQFKHEKSWDMSTAPSLYEKYFEINMDSLATAICTIPFYKRNSIDQTLISETELISMNNRASKYKVKYFNDKSFSTPETNAHDTILKSLRENFTIKDEKTDSNKLLEEKVSDSEEKSDNYEVNLDMKSTECESTHSSMQLAQGESKTAVVNEVHDFDKEFLFEDQLDNKIRIPDEIEKTSFTKNDQEQAKQQVTDDAVKLVISENTSTSMEHPGANLVIKSPEDLEKWLDDFLDS